MKVVAIIVTYNGSHWVERCFGSLRDSRHPVSVIAVDNGSTDGTPAMLRQRFPDVEVVETGRNLGFGQGNNLGLRMALERGADHVFLLNQDAWVLADTVGRLVDAAARHPEHGVLSPMHLNGPGDALDREFAHDMAAEKFAGLYADLALGRAGGRVYDTPFVNAAAWLITRRCLLTVGGFDPAFFHYAEDDNYLHRVHFHGLKVGLVPDAFIHHDHSQRTSNPYFDDLRRFRLRMIRLKYADPGRALVPEEERTALRRNMLQAMLRLRKDKVLVARDHLKMLEEADLAEVLRNRERASRPGPTFLEGPAQ